MADRKMDVQELLLEIAGQIGELRAEVRSNTALTQEVKLYQEKQNGRVFTLADKMNEMDRRMVARENSCPLMTPIKADLEAIKTDMLKRDEHSKTNKVWFSAVLVLGGSGVTMLVKHFIDTLAK
jgi:hypothetical protein